MQGARRRGANLLRSRHRFDPGDVGSACLETFGELAERLDRGALGQGAQRLEQLTCRADRAGNDHRAWCRFGNLAGDLGGPLGQFVDPALGAVQLETVAIAAEGVGQDDVGAGIDELLMQVTHLFGMIGIPELGRIAGTETTFEVVGARCAVSQQRAASRQEFGK